MAEVQANITLTTTGGDAAAAEINKASSAIQNVTASSSALQSNFQERFQHIGLMLFAGDALRASGLGAETRMVVTSLNAALMATESAAGIGSGGILLLVTAMVALGGIIAKVVDHHKDLIDSLEKLHDAQQKQIQTTSESLAAVQNYIQAGGQVTPAIQAWESALQNLEVVEIKHQQLLDYQAVSALKAAIAQQELNLATLQSIKPEDLQYLENVSKGTVAATIAMQGIKKAIDDQSLSMDKNKAKMAELIVELENLRTGNVKTMSQMAQDAKTSFDAQEKAWEDMADKISAGEKAQYALITKLHDDITKDQQAQYKQQQKDLSEHVKIVTEGIGKVATDFGDAFGKMIVEGKSFTDEMTQAFTSMVEQMISQILKLIAEWAIFTAMSGMGGGIGAIGARGLANMGGFALGGQVMVDQPTLFMAGEAGPEMASFTPMSGSSSDSGGSGTVINLAMTVNANGVSDPNKLAQLIGPALIREIRAQGQLNFSRG